MLVEQFQIGPCIVDMFGWCRSLATGTDGIEALGIKGPRRFKANVTLPLGIIIVDVPETLAPLEAEAPQHDMARIGAVAAIILAKNGSMRWSWARVVSPRIRSRRQMSGLMPRRTMRN